MAKKEFDLPIELLDAMEDRITRQISGLEARVTALEESRIETTKALQAVQADTGKAVAILETLLQDDKAVLRRTPGRAIMDKERVYAAAARNGIRRRDFFRALDAEGLIRKETEGPPRRYTNKARVDGDSVRVVIINV